MTEDKIKYVFALMKNKSSEMQNEGFIYLGINILNQKKLS